MGQVTGITTDDKEQIRQLYHDMYAAMVAKDRAELERVHDDGFLLIHMTGMHQSKQRYISAIMDGTLNYYSEKTDSIDINLRCHEWYDLVGKIECL